MLALKWQEAYQAALFENNTSKLASLIDAARQAIFREVEQREISALERRKMHGALKVLTLLEGPSDYAA
jgi:hypothetical protein